MKNLRIQNLHVEVEGKEILKGISLKVAPGEVHVVMGPNGSGKSTFAYTLMGHPSYKCQMSNVPAKQDLAPPDKCQMRIGRKNLMFLPTEERARAGLYLAIQSPIAIPGVSVMQLLRSSYQEIYPSAGSGQAKRAIQNPVLARRWQANGMGLPEFITMVKKYTHELLFDE